MTGDYAVFQIAQSWTEDEATWENAAKERKWANAGSDFISKAVVKATWPRSNGNAWVKFNVLPLIQNFVKIPEMNYGLLIRNVSGAQEIVIPSSEYPSAALRPKLTITYDEGSSTKAPKRAFSPAGMALKVQPHGLQLIAGDKAAATSATISCVNGRQVLNCHVQAGKSRSVTGLGAGIYLITFKKAGYTERTAVSIVP
jgi:hypothetical protein